MTPQLEKLVNLSLEKSREAIREGKETPPHFLIIDRNDKGLILMTQFVAPTAAEIIEQKNTFMMKVKVLMIHVGAKEYAFVSESWMTKIKKPEEWDGTLPMADREEVLSIAFEDEIWNYPIHRFGDNAILGDPDKMASGKNHGRFSSMIIKGKELPPPLVILSNMIMNRAVEILDGVRIVLL